MADEKIKVCDRSQCPRKGAKVQRYKIDMGNQVFQADLCPEHAMPVREFIATFPAHFIVKIRDGGRSTTSFRVHTMDEIEELKRRGSSE